MRRDVAEIKVYMSQFYESTFSNFMKKLKRSASLLENMPYIGTMYKGYHRLIVDDYLVFYKVDDVLKIVEIYRVIHGSKDIQESSLNWSLCRMANAVPENGQF